MTISVIIPVFKVENYIAASLRSVFAQGIPNLEIILVNDCSPDKSIEIVESLRGEKPAKMALRILEHKSNQGLSAARNTGLLAASGEYIYFLDSDDILAPGALAHLAELAIRFDADITIGRSHRFSSERDLSDIMDVDILHSNPELQIWQNTEDILLAFSRNEWPMSGCNKLIRKNILLKNHLFFIPGLLHEDGIWNFQTAFHFNSMVISSACTYAYRCNPESITAKITWKNIESFGIIAKLYYDLLLQLPLAMRRKMCAWFEENIHNMTNHAAQALEYHELKQWYHKCRKHRLPFAEYLRAQMSLTQRFWAFLRYCPDCIGCRVYCYNSKRLQKKQRCAHQQIR